jgi:uncharacterized Tic20 family protein
VTDVSTANTVSAGWGSDLRIAAVAAMAPFLAGVLVLLGYLWLGGFGIVLGLGGAIGWAVWWYRKHGKFFPRDVDRGAFGITVVITVVALVITLLAM